MKKIIFVDDDRYFAHLYLDALREHYEVIICYEAETAIKAFEDNDDVEGAIIDVMMPPPAGREHETHDGNTTGLWLLTQVREILAQKRLPVVLFTNKAIDFVRSEVCYLELDTQLVEVHAKGGVDEDQLPHLLGKLIGRR